ncbi:MCP four helix bundle domain-containing protein, partial [Desulfofundulus sp.]|uniref:MCP four helix bundle domain-containing protein n=1 Tax=Desulfofundulus sp. TaxID=2282750 RepID=UPI003C7285B4
MRVPIGMKIGGGFVLLLLFMVVVVVQSLFIMGHTVTNAGNVDQRVVRLSLDYQILDAFKEASRDLRAALLYGDSRYLNEYSGDVQNARSLLEKRLNNCTAETRLKLQEVLALVNKYDQQISSRAIPLAREGKFQEAVAEAQGVATYANDAEKILCQLIVQNEQRTSDIMDRMQSYALHGRFLVLFVGICALLIGLLMAVIITR